MLVNRQQLYDTLNTAALDLLRAGDAREALHRWEEARAICRGYPVQEFSVLTWIAQCHENLGEPEKAIAVLEELLVLKQAGGFRVQHELVDRIAALKRSAAQPTKRVAGAKSTGAERRTGAPRGASRPAKARATKRTKQARRTK